MTRRWGYTFVLNRWIEADEPVRAMALAQHEEVAQIQAAAKGVTLPPDKTQRIEPLAWVEGTDDDGNPTRHLTALALARMTDRDAQPDATLYRWEWTP